MTIDPARRVIMVEGVHACRRDIRIVRQIPRRIEIGVRIASFLPADRLVVLQRVDMHGGDVGLCCRE